MQLQLEHFDLSCRFVGILLKIVESAALQLCLKPLKKWSEAKPAEATWAKAGRSKRGLRSSLKRDFAPR